MNGTLRRSGRSRFVGWPAASSSQRRDGYSYGEFRIGCSKKVGDPYCVRPKYLSPVLPQSAPQSRSMDSLDSSPCNFRILRTLQLINIRAVGLTQEQPQTLRQPSSIAYNHHCIRRRHRNANGRNLVARDK